MAHISKNENLTKLRGSEQHHDLKNRPGEDGDPTHMVDEDKVTIETAPASKTDAKDA